MGDSVTAAMEHLPMDGTEMASEAVSTNGCRESTATTTHPTLVPVSTSFLSLVWLSLVTCLLTVGAFCGPVLLLVYYTRGPELTTTPTNCTWWPEPLPPSASSNTISTKTCMFRRVNITEPKPEGWKDPNSERSKGLTTDEAWHNALNNNYLFLGTTSDLQLRVQSTNNSSSSSFVCHTFWVVGYKRRNKQQKDVWKDVKVGYKQQACAKVAERCSDDCKWAAPLGYNPNSIVSFFKNKGSIDWSLYANKKRVAVFMTPQDIESISVNVKNWGIGLTVFLISFVVGAASLKMWKPGVFL